MTKECKQNIALEFQHEPVYTLGEILEFKTVPILKKLAGFNGIRGTSGMNKPELLRAIAEAMPDEKRMADNLTMLSAEEWALFQKAAALRELEESMSDQIPLLLISMGYLAAFHKDGKMVYVVPEEIKASLHNLMQSGYGDEWIYVNLLNQYALAATSLYGVITIDDFVELFNSQNERKTDVDDVCSLLMRFIASNEGYCFWEEYIVNDGFEKNDFKDVGRIAKTAASKPRYIPDKEKFLRYAEEPCLDATPQMLNQWMNNGAAPNELIENAEKPVPKPLPVQPGQPYRNKKIGRNEPCPCGSGKKYKKCCLL